MKKLLLYNDVESVSQCICRNSLDGAVTPERRPRSATSEFLLSGLQHRDLGDETSFQDTLKCESVTFRDMDEIVKEILLLNHGQVLGMTPMERYLSEVGHWTPLHMGEKGLRRSPWKHT